MNLLDMVLHVDRSVAVVFHDWGWAAWALVFLIIFIETGVVVFPFLPGDSLLFACGAFAAAQNEDVFLFLALIAVAAVVGNTVNWFIGLKFGELLLRPRPGKKPLIKPDDIEKTQRFFDRWGGWAVTLGRFLPIIRTLTPFVAGLGRMSFGKFSFYNVLGGVVWTVLFVLAGFFFGSLAWVKDNFSLVVLALIVIPGAPAVITVFVRWLRSRKTSS
jgi:membrane-associated protein